MVPKNEQERYPFGRGNCSCGCGTITTISKRTDPRYGAVKDEPVRFVQGHQSLKSPPYRELPSGSKVCVSCNNVLNYSDFNNSKDKKDGLSASCRNCRSKRQSSEKYKIKANRIKRRSYLKKYGLTPESYEEKLTSQNGTCYICGNPETKIHPQTGLIKRLSIDHDHTTGQTRSLLCFRCNTVLGRIQDNPSLLRKMADYLEHHKPKD